MEHINSPPDSIQTTIELEAGQFFFIQEFEIIEQYWSIMARIKGRTSKETD